MGGRRALLLIGGILLAAAGLALTPTGERIRADVGPMVATVRARVAALIPERRDDSSTGAQLPAARTAIEDGRTLVRLTPAERARIGLVAEARPATLHRQELTAYGSVLELARITELTNSYAGAVAALQTARARVEVSASAARRARTLGAGVVAVAQIETVEGTLLTDQASVTVAESQLRTLAATARQEWGSVLGKAIIERSPLVTRLIERTDFLMQVTLPPGETLPEAPQAAFAEVPPQSERVALRLVSAATRTDPRIQGQSFFYLVTGDSGLLPGTSTMAFLPAPRAVKGVLVPEDAVVHGEGGTWVYRGTGDGAFVRHPVRPDAPMSADAFVVEDLPDGSEIVLRGAQALLSEEMKSRIRVVGDDDD
ncbi:efflux RND transporter periplasmic adaptor subunit [Methylobacterium sp. NMS14P]|uniref:efflux RND transporter periplasmic adaptor subunit n=1 Tax=Methylobacterium sp. NMS14P TaxID=2894310 RepID=UPI00235A3CB1|nr:efflux RND transporter periplasmic adaptor subunit [Methylobacterium sp. NMS14P]WCS23029.1 efflux RND transporter periplasmic adaptor subunit [Methylobacterium sp. NMS14P]